MAVRTRVNLGQAALCASGADLRAHIPPGGLYRRIMGKARRQLRRALDFT
jgi:hypothetical protein